MNQTFETAYNIVKQLSENFQQGEKHYLSKSYQEAEVRKDFIDKFWIALGWDVHHDFQKNPYEQEVKVEKGVNVSGAQKRADYSFTIAPNFRDPKFFVEAKKPSQNLYNEDYYFQTVRYGWHKGTPLSVLMDFEELHILDCRFSPTISNILNRQWKRYHYLDYTDEKKFSEIYWLFSREAILNNSIDKILENLPKSRGKSTSKKFYLHEKQQSIDEDFLNYIEEKREFLAKALKKNDESLNSEQLTEATQKILDRLVFIRFLEDKLIEQDHYVSRFGEKGKTWNDFIDLCKKFDAKYNGIVFKRSIIDRDSFKGPVDKDFYIVCQDICHLNSKFLFNEIPIHILGSIYERFLGKVVHATEKRVKVEEKPEVRKAGGVFYTPKAIVDYIVRNTVGKLIEEKTPEQITKLRFIDLACGSGSFLISVFELLLDYHNKYYLDNPEKAKKAGCSKTADGAWVLSIKQKQNILKNNIFGIDIDSQAVEVTQLSLSLKLLEDETTATANEMQVLFHEKILPDMSKNIVCGNAIIGTDIISPSIFSEYEEHKLNPIDYSVKFPEILRNGGFDAIVGNPPYFRIDDTRLEYNYIRNKYRTTEFKVDVYTIFLEKAISEIGFKRLGVIIPNTLMTNLTDRKLRKLILEKTHIDEIINYKIPVFDQAVVHTMILILDNNIDNKFINIKEVNKDKIDTYQLEQHDFLNNTNFSFDIRMFGEDSTILNKIKLNGIRFEQLCDLRQAIKTGDDKKFISLKKIKNNFKKVLGGSEIKRYHTKWSGRFVDYGSHLACPRDPYIFEIDEKLIIRETGKRITATYDNEGFYLMSSVYSAFLLDNVKEYNLKFILAALNSNVSQFFMQKLCFENSSGAFIKARIFHYKQLPIPKIDFNDVVQKAIHDKIVNLVEQMIDANIKLENYKTDREKDYYENKCLTIDRNIDLLVYQLFGFTSDEITIIENSLN